MLEQSLYTVSKVNDQIKTEHFVKYPVQILQKFIDYELQMIKCNPDSKLNQNFPTLT